jgi:hypothetical protein
LINNRQNNNRRRGRGGGGPRPNGSNPGNDRGNRIDNRARGNANQLFEKYKTMARDAQMQGDRVMSEYYFQFADHYFRVLSETRSRFEEQNRGRPDQFDRDDQDDYGDEGEGAENAAPAPNYNQRDNNQRDYNQRDSQRDNQRDYNQRDYNEPRGQNDLRGQNEQRPPRPQRRAPEPEPVAVDAEEAPAYGANGHGAVSEAPAEEAPVRTVRRGRPKARKEEASADLLANVDRPQREEARIEIDRLPPSFTPEPEPAEKPKRRGRPRRSESAAADA